MLGSCEEASREHCRSRGTDSQQDSSGDADINPFAVYPPFTKWDYVKVFCSCVFQIKKLRVNGSARKTYLRWCGVWIMHDRSAIRSPVTMVHPLQTPHPKLSTLVVSTSSSCKQIGALGRPENGGYCVSLQSAWASQSKTAQDLPNMEEMCPPSLPCRS